MRYTGEVIKAFNKLQDYRSIIPDAGTSVTVEFWNGAEWVVDDQSPIIVPDLIYARGLKVRLTPDTGGFMFDSEGAI